MRKFTAALLAMGCIVGVTSTYALPVQTNLKKEVVVKAITSKPVETIGEKEAGKIGNKIAPVGAKYDDTRLVVVGDKAYYQVRYLGENSSFIATIDAYTGKVVTTNQNNAIIKDQQTANRVDGSTAYIPHLSEQKAIEIANNQFLHGKTVKNELVKKDGYWVYEVTIQEGDYLSKVYVNPENAKVEQTTSTSIWKPSEEKPVFDPNKPILDQIKDLIGGKLPEGALGNGKVTEFELDTDDGKTIAEITLISGGMEYEFEIDTVTGQIIDMEMEEEDDEDNNDENHKKPIINPAVKPNKDTTANSNLESKKETSNQVQNDDDDEEDDDKDEDDD
nr:PepSY domain-containing protein [uncultured Niameybacter sp.]